MVKYSSQITNKCLLVYSRDCIVMEDLGTPSTNKILLNVSLLR